jgi:hypothetical protein
VDLKYVIVGQEVEILFHGQPCRFQIMQAKDQSGTLYGDSNTLITTVQQTKVIIVSAPTEKEDTNKQKMSYSNIGGLEEQIRIVREMVETPLQNPELFQKYGMFIASFFWPDFIQCFFNASWDRRPTATWCLTIRPARNW